MRILADPDPRLLWGGPILFLCQKVLRDPDPAKKCRSDRIRGPQHCSIRYMRLCVGGYRTVINIFALTSFLILLPAICWIVWTHICRKMHSEKENAPQKHLLRRDFYHLLFDFTGNYSRTFCVLDRTTSFAFLSGYRKKGNPKIPKQTVWHAFVLLLLRKI